MQITDKTKKLAIRALSKELGGLVTKLETGYFFDSPSVVEKRDAIYAALVELGDNPAFARERCRRLNAAFPFIPDLPEVTAGVVA